jgi:predicted dehydrogenase
MHKVTMLGTGLIGLFYTMSINGQRSRDSVSVVQSRTPKRAEEFAREHGIPKWTADMKEAIEDPDSSVVVVGLPNYQHRDAIVMAAEAGKAVMCTKPLARTAEEAKECLEAVEKAGVFHGYLEDLVYTPKTLKAIAAIKDGAVGSVMWTRSRETHPGPHSAWFWDKELAGGGSLIDMGCHCIEVGRSYIGKDIKPVEVMCYTDTVVHPIDAEDTAIGLVRYQNGAISQFESSWTFRGGMDLRDEVSGTDGTIWLNHWLRTGFEMFSSGGQGYVAEKAETETGWIFPVGDEVGALGYVDMFTDMFDALDEGREPRETFYDGYVVNAIMDACYRSAESKKWEPVDLEIWRGREEVEPISASREYDDEHNLIKVERMPDGKVKYIVKHKETGEISQIVKDE